MVRLVAFMLRVFGGTEIDKNENNPDLWAGEELHQMEKCIATCFLVAWRAVGY